MSAWCCVWHYKHHYAETLENQRWDHGDKAMKSLCTHVHQPLNVYIHIHRYCLNYSQGCETSSRSQYYQEFLLFCLPYSILLYKQTRIGKSGSDSLPVACTNTSLIFPVMKPSVKRRSLNIYHAVCSQEFEANKDGLSFALTVFQPEIRARYLRIHPQKQSIAGTAMFIRLLGCIDNADTPTCKPFYFSIVHDISNNYQ